MNKYLLYTMDTIEEYLAYYHNSYKTLDEIYTRIKSEIEDFFVFSLGDPASILNSMFTDFWVDFCDGYDNYIYVDKESHTVDCRCGDHFLSYAIVDMEQAMKGEE